MRLKLNVESAGAQLQMALVAQGLGLGLVPRAALAASPWRDEIDGPQPQRFSACGLAVADPRPVSGQPAAAADFFASKVVQQLTVSD
jgi:DNA-binding transcriptional LysR family regulator